MGEVTHIIKAEQIHDLELVIARLRNVADRTTDSFVASLLKEAIAQGTDAVEGILHRLITIQGNVMSDTVTAANEDESKFWFIGVYPDGLPELSEAEKRQADKEATVERKSDERRESIA